MQLESKNVLNVAVAKKRFSEILDQVVHHQKRFLIGRRGKPMIGIIPAHELKEISSAPKKGFLSLVGLWSEVVHVDKMVKDIYKKRAKETKRPIPSLADH